MIIGIIIGRKGSVGFPNKNMARVCGRPMCEHVIIKAVKNCDKVYVSTDDTMIKYHAIRHGAGIINRPPELCTKEAFAEDVFVHAYEEIGDNNVFYALMMCNAPMLLDKHFKEGLTMLADKKYDSACTVSKYNMFAPARMRNIKDGHLITPYQSGTCDRDSTGDWYIIDSALAIVRPKCLENLSAGTPPQRWIGNSVYPIINTAGLDVDYEWQLGQLEWWLKNEDIING